jgi:type VI protein secretion system component Hcp
MTISRLVLAVVGAAGLAAAQNTIVVRVDGVGDCPALNWTFDASQTYSPAGSGGTGSGRAQATALVVNRQLDQCSPHLFQLVPLGQHVQSVVVTQYDSTGRIPVLIVTLGGVVVSNYQVGGSTATSAPSEAVAFTFGTIKLEYRSPSGGGSVDAGWDFTRNVKM